MESKTRRFWTGLGMAHTSLTFVYPQRQPGEPVKNPAHTPSKNILDHADCPAEDIFPAFTASNIVPLTATLISWRFIFRSSTFWRQSVHHSLWMPGRSVFFCLVISLSGSLCTSSTGRAAETPAIAFGRAFGDDMVLQQEMPIPLWGTATPGESIEVSFRGETVSARTDLNGSWHATLPPMQSSGMPSSCVLRNQQDQVVLKNCLVGEVWLCAGQSNMLLPVSKTSGAPRVVAAAYHPHLRILAFDTTTACSSAAAFADTQLQSLEPSSFLQGTWTVCLPEHAAAFPAVPYFFGESLLRKRHVPIGIISVAVGGTPTEAWIQQQALRSHPQLATLMTDNWLTAQGLEGWCRQRAKQNLDGPLRDGKPIPGDNHGPNHPFKPGFMWSAGIAPLIPLAVRGVAWYQGESNADSPARVQQHDLLLPFLIADWRKAWGRPRLPFGIVQLPGLGRPDWPAFRESQRRITENLADTGLIVTIDLGDRLDVHPGDKQPIGERLALWADEAVYKKNEGVANGPLPTKAILLDSGDICIHFRDTGDGLKTTDGLPPRHFEVGTEEGVFQKVAARIENNTVVLNCSEPSFSTHSQPRIRYAWQPFPTPPVNLVNSSDLPASPFELPAQADHE
jgi:sialate O-acetylesterase